MSTDVSIIIRAQDQFSGTFEQLRSTLDRTRATGATTESVLGGMGESLDRLAAQSSHAESSLAEFAEGTSARLDELSEEEKVRMEEMGQTQVDFAEELAARLLAVDETFLVQKEVLHDAAAARLAQIQAAHLNDLLEREREYGDKSSQIRSESLSGQVALYNEFYSGLKALAEDHGKTLFRIVKTLGVAQAYVGAYVAANKALAEAPYPFNLALSALVLAQGLANVERIRQTNVAHGGIDSVPEDATFLLRQGERVLSPGQNRELTQFLAGRNEGQDSGSVSIDTLNIHILENATSAEALLSMDASELRRVISERIIPTLDELARLGIRPQFVESNL